MILQIPPPDGLTLNGSPISLNTDLRQEGGGTMIQNLLIELATVTLVTGATPASAPRFA